MQVALIAATAEGGRQVVRILLRAVMKLLR